MIVADVKAWQETLMLGDKFYNSDLRRIGWLLTTLMETRVALERLVDVCRYVGPEDNPLLHHSWDYAKAEARRVLGEV